MAWALAIALIFSSIIVVLSILYINFRQDVVIHNPDGSRTIIDDADSHGILRIGLLGLIAAFFLYLISIMDFIVRESNVTDAALRTVLDSAITIIGILVYLFIFYLLIHMIYFFTNKAMDSWKTRKDRRFGGRGF